MEGQLPINGDRTPRTESPLEISKRESEQMKSNSITPPAPLLLHVPNSPLPKFHDKRYRSPTDLLISPVSKGLLAKNPKVKCDALLVFHGINFGTQV